MQMTGPRGQPHPMATSASWRHWSQMAEPRGVGVEAVGLLGGVHPTPNPLGDFARISCCLCPIHL